MRRAAAPWPAGWRVWRVALLAALLALGHGAARAQAPPDAPAPQVLHQAEFQAPGATDWRPVALPHDWSRAGLATPATGRYRLRFHLPPGQNQPWALWARDMAPGRSVWLNGQLVHQQLQQPSHWHAKRPGMALVELPPALLRPGANLLELQQSFGTAGYLSAPWVGPIDAVQLHHHNQHLLWNELPAGLNLAAAGLGLFMVAVWWQRRSEAVIGSFGVVWLLLSLRNMTYYAPAAPVGNLSSWLFYTVQVWSAPMVGLFAMTLSRQRPRWFVRTLWAVALVLPLAGVAAALADQLVTLRRWTYPLLVLLYLPSLVLMFRATRGLRGRHLLPVAVGLALTIAAGTHDLLYALNHWRGAGQFLLPFAMPLTMAGFAWILVRRLVHGLVRTERQKDALERRVAERTRELQDANAAKGRFIAAASHDLRQPVLSLGLMAGMLRDEPTSPDAPRLVQRMHDAAVTLERMVQGLLDLSRLDAAAARRQPVALHELLATLVAQQADTAAARGLALRLRAAPRVLDSDPVLLEQVLRNLLGNALRYTREGGVLLALRPRADGSVHLRVWDTGPGIAPQHQERIFDEFVRIDEGTRPRGQDRDQGVGLGLAIARRAAQGLGGTLALRSRPGRGSCFTLSLPPAR